MACSRSASRRPFPWRAGARQSGTRPLDRAPSRRPGAWASAARGRTTPGHGIGGHMPVIPLAGEPDVWPRRFARVTLHGRPPMLPICVPEVLVERGGVPPGDGPRRPCDTAAGGRLLRGRCPDTAARRPGTRASRRALGRVPPAVAQVASPGRYGGARRTPGGYTWPRGIRRTSSRMIASSTGLLRGSARASLASMVDPRP
jgi:hypothetical protein